VAEPADSAPEPVEGELVPAGEEAAEARPLPVLSEGDPAALEGLGPASVPATIAAATGGFLLGVGAFLLVRVLRRPAAGRSLSRRRRRLADRRGVDVQATRSFLVDVHLLKR